MNCPVCRDAAYLSGRCSACLYEDAPPEGLHPPGEIPQFQPGTACGMLDFARAEAQGMLEAGFAASVRAQAQLSLDALLDAAEQGITPLRMPSLAGDAPEMPVFQKSAPVSAPDFSAFGVRHEGVTGVLGGFDDEAGFDDFGLSRESFSYEAPAPKETPASEDEDGEEDSPEPSGINRRAALIACAITLAFFGVLAAVFFL